MKSKMIVTVELLLEADINAQYSDIQKLLLLDLRRRAHLGWAVNPDCIDGFTVKGAN